MLRALFPHAVEAAVQRPSTVRSAIKAHIALAPWIAMFIPQPDHWQRHSGALEVVQLMLGLGMAPRAAAVLLQRYSAAAAASVTAAAANGGGAAHAAAGSEAARESHNLSGAAGVVTNAVDVLAVLFSAQLLSRLLTGVLFAGR